MTVRLDKEALAEALAGLPDWRRDGDAIVRHVAIAGFSHPLLLAVAIGHLAETAKHHPDLTIRYGSLRIRLSTHEAGGVTARDVALARQINSLIA